MSYKLVPIMMRSGNIFRDLKATEEAEQFRDLLTTPALRVERIVSLGQATPEGQWLNQERAEFVLLLAGSAAILFEGESTPRVLEPGDYLEIAAHRRHRVAWTDRAQPTVWLALHYG